MMSLLCRVPSEVSINLVISVFPSSSPDSTLYLAGGEFPDGSASREMWRYDPCFDSWIEMAPMNVARSELGEAASVPLSGTENIQHQK